MSRLPGKPAGCSIEEIPGASGMALTWPIPAMSVQRYGVAAFLLFWLGGWAVGWIAAAGQLARGGVQPFLVFWLGGWTVGGVWVVWCLWTMLRPARPELVSLDLDLLRYDPGRVPMNPFAQHQRNWWGGSANTESKRLRCPVEVNRSEIRAFVLDRIGERQRLWFDHGAERVEIGESLREPEREWLHAVLEAWRCGSSTATTVADG